MSIQTEINRISDNVSDTLDAIEAKGVEIPADANSDDLASLVSQIEGGGSDLLTIHIGLEQVIGIDPPTIQLTDEQFASLEECKSLFYADLSDIPGLQSLTFKFHTEGINVLNFTSAAGSEIDELIVDTTTKQAGFQVNYLAQLSDEFYINPNQIPIDGNTIYINDDGVLESEGGGGINFAVPTFINVNVPDYSVVGIWEREVNNSDDAIEYLKMGIPIRAGIDFRFSKDAIWTELLNSESGFRTGYCYIYNGSTWTSGTIQQPYLYSNQYMVRLAWRAFVICTSREAYKKLMSSIYYDNTASGLTATTIPDAIDEVNDKIPTVEANPETTTDTLTGITIGDTSYAVGGGGSSYTFTDGLTESSGTVSVDNTVLRTSGTQQVGGTLGVNKLITNTVYSGTSDSQTNARIELGNRSGGYDISLIPDRWAPTREICIHNNYLSPGTSANGEFDLGRSTTKWNNGYFNGIVEAQSLSDGTTTKTMTEVLAGGGGSSYTFTDGLTETDGTVSWDLNDCISKDSHNNIILVNGGGSSIQSATENNTIISSYYPSVGWINGNTKRNIITGFTNSIGNNYNQQKATTDNFIGGSNCGINTSKFARGEGAGAATNCIVFGEGLLSCANSQAVFGKFNEKDTTDKYTLILGNGTSDSARSNALTVSKTGILECTNIPAAPTTDGNYVLKCSIVDGAATYSWVAEV